jgi:peptidoglycan/LPS O-acetylase OafA/YrhL
MSIGRRNRQIDLIRGLSILLVLFHHFNIAYPLNDTLLARAIGWDAVRAVARNGNYGVTMFFVISGYLITTNADRRWAGLANIRARAFYSLRAARIIPCLVLLLLLVNLLAAAGVSIFQNHAPNGTPVSFWMVNVASLTFWMNVLISRDGWINYPLGVLWSLSVEEVFYLVFPILCLLLRREARLIAFLIVVIAIGPLYRMFHQGEEESFLYAYFACFDGIAIGCCTALLAKRISLQGSTAVALRVAIAAAMMLLYLCAPIGQTNVLGVTAMAFGTGVLLWGAHDRPSGSVLERSRSLAVVGWFGRLSYELYLFHLIVLGAMKTLFPRQLVAGDEKLVLLVCFLALSICLSALIGRLYSEPLNRAIRNRLAGRVNSEGVSALS